MMQHEIVVPTAGQGCYEITDLVSAHLSGTGLVTLFIRHSSASLLVQENTDPAVQSDLLAYCARLVPPSDDPSMDYLEHISEGTDDMPSHIKASLLPTSIGIPVRDGRMLLGHWQGVFVIEHRNKPMQREVMMHFSG